MSRLVWIVTFLICLLAASAQPSSPQLNDNSTKTTDNASNPNVTMSLNDIDAQIVNVSQAPSAVPTSVSTTKSEFCRNTEGWTFGVSIKYTCDDEFVWCSDADAMENCCKCKPSCCGYCRGRNHAHDPHQPCQYEPTLRPTSIHMLSPPNVSEGPPPKKKKLDRLDLGLLIGGFAFIILFIVGAIMFRINRNQRREILNLRRTMAERRNDPTSAHNADGLASERESRIGSSFFFDTVLPDKSNANAVNLRSLRDVIEASENEDQTNSTRKSIQEDGPKKQGPRKSSSKQQRPSAGNGISISDLRKHLAAPKRSQRSQSSLRNVFSSWRKQADTGECSICLECYNPGEMICVAKADTCNHVFHKECLVEWLKNHDCCPLCRVNLLVEEKE